MYKQYYGFKERPFKLVPNPHYLFLSKSHEEALGHLRYAVTHGEGFVEITGEVGTGKTTLLRVFLDKLAPDIEAAFIFNPKLNSTQLLKTINDEFGIDATPDNTKDLIDILNAYLIEKKAEQKKVIILIDEAQNLSIEVLEQLRLLSNLETTQSKLLQIILVGQPELADKLDSYELRQLEQRITLSCHITPLSFQETRDYINHRISIASHRPGVKFTLGAYLMIYQYSNGIPRLINIACDRALLAGFTQDMKKITRKIVKTAVKELVGRRGHKVRSMWLNKKSAPLLIGLGLLALGFFLFPMDVIRQGKSSDTPVSCTEEKNASERIDKFDASPGAGTITKKQRSQDSPDPSGDTAADRKAVKAQDVPKTAAKPETPPTRVEKKVAADKPEAPEPISEEERSQLALQEKTKIAMAVEKELMASTSPGKKNKKVEGLGDVLADMDTKMSRFLAINTLIEYWEGESGLTDYFEGIKDDFEFFKQAAEQAGLKVNQIPGDLKVVSTLNIPVIMTLHLPDASTPRYMTVTGLDRQKVVFSLSDRQVQATPRELTRFWDGELFVIWKDFLNFSDIIPLNASANAILSLKMHLKEIGYDNITMNGTYDDAALGVIKDVQKENGLTVDGVVGPLTKIVLYNQKGDLSIPHIAR